MKPWALLCAVFVLAAALAIVRLAPPSPAPASAPAGAFSAVRAMTDVRAMAQRPHPIGSPEALRVQNYLFGRMRALGLQPDFHAFASPKGEGRNILGVLPGTDRSAPAVMLMAHSDSVPTGPGAADDGAGVAAVLETVRALEASGPRRRDVMVLITDGEELDLNGGEAFFNQDPARDHVGVVVNLEARGDQGRAAMFETHRGAAPLIAFLLRAGALKGASSLMPDVYRRMPNDTDLTPALKSGKAGLNLAFFDNLAAYHRPSDTPRNLSQASLQDIGDQALAAARALAAAPALPTRAPDKAYGDILGGPVVQYGPITAAILVFLAVLGLSIAAFQAVADGSASLKGLIGGALAFLGLLFATAALLLAVGWGRGVLVGAHLAPLLKHETGVLAGVALAGVGAGLAWLSLSARRLTPVSTRLGALTLMTALALALQLAAPLDAFIVVWPVLLTALGAGAAAMTRRPWLALPFALAATAQIFYWTGLIFGLQGQTLPVALTPFLVLAVMALAPLAPQPGRRTAWVGAACAAAGAGLTLLAVAI